MVQRNNDPGFLTLDVVRRPATDINGAIEVVSYALVDSVRTTTELEMTNRPGGLTSTPSRIPGSVTASIRISSDVTVADSGSPTDFHTFNRKTQLAFLKGMEGAVVTAYARSIPATGFLGKVRSVAIEDDQSNDQMFVATVSIRQVFQSEQEEGPALGGVIRLPALPPRDPDASEENADQEDQPKGTGSHKCLTVFNKKLNRRESIFLGLGLVTGGGPIGAAAGVGVAKVSQSKWFRGATGFAKRQFRKTAIVGGVPEALRDAFVETGEALNDARKNVIRFGECEN